MTISPDGSQENPTLRLVVWEMAQHHWLMVSSLGLIRRLRSPRGAK